MTPCLPSTSSNLLLVYHSFLLFPSSSLPILIFLPEPHSVSAAYLSNIRSSLISSSLISRNDSLLLRSTQTLFPRLYISLKCFPTSSRLSFLFMTLCSRPVADLTFSYYSFFFVCVSASSSTLFLSLVLPLFFSLSPYKDSKEIELLAMR